MRSRCHPECEYCWPLCHHALVAECEAVCAAREVELDLARELELDPFEEVDVELVPVELL